MLCSGPRLWSQDSLRARFGAFGHYALNNHVADFARMPTTVSCCSTYTGGSGSGFSTGLLFEYPVAKSLLLSLRASYLTQTFTMITREPTRVISNGLGADGAFEHRLDGSFSSIGIEPLVAYNPLPSLLFYGGVRVAVIGSSNYIQKEQLTEPAGVGTFLNPDGTDSRLRTRNAFVGEIPNTSLQASLLIGVGYDLPLNRAGSMVLTPEVFYQIGISNVTSDLNWKVNALRMGIAVKYSPHSTSTEELIRERKNELDPVSQKPTIIAQTDPRNQIDEIERLNRYETPVVQDGKRESLTAGIRVVGVDAHGMEQPNVVLRVEEFISTLMTPLLSYVFFEHNSAELPSRFQRLTTEQTSTFLPERVNSTARLPTYYHLLNIVAHRLKYFPKATITLTGCTDDNDDEKANLELARRRADSVKAYLVRVWNIDARRIRVGARTLPLSASNSLTKDGAEENRRVEISASIPDILTPLVSRDTLRISNPPTLRFKPSITAEAGIKSWNISASQRGALLKEFSGNSDVSASLDWELSVEQGTVPTSLDSIHTTIQATDNNDSTAAAKASIAVDYVSLQKKRIEQRGDTEIDRYSLILFDVRSATLSDANRRIVEFVKKNLRVDSKIGIIGYTDRLGEQQYNQSLAESRAKAVATSLGRASDLTIEAKGNSNLYNNNLPEGRFYSRTVDIEVQTPVR
jgi:outer membrane protein OmpA-like peptidoglycan-associated protein